MKIWLKKILYYPKFALIIVSTIFFTSTFIFAMFDLLYTSKALPFQEGYYTAMFEQTNVWLYVWLLLCSMGLYLLAKYIPSEPKSIWVK